MAGRVKAELVEDEFGTRRAGENDGSASPRNMIRMTYHLSCYSRTNNLGTKEILDAARALPSSAQLSGRDFGTSYRKERKVGSNQLRKLRWTIEMSTEVIIGREGMNDRGAGRREWGKRKRGLGVIDVETLSVVSIYPGPWFRMRGNPSPNVLGSRGLDLSHYVHSQCFKTTKQKKMQRSGLQVGNLTKLPRESFKCLGNRAN
ncbi:hypothetical protein B0H13DRAFT_1851597 [Mycena leptocephala]|nr:hypothetical protein B0H13DRAFT_1851597 [Mycena leptocephala]